MGVEMLYCHPLAKTVTGGWGNIEYAWMRHSIQLLHYNDVIMGTMASQITSLTSVYSAVYSGADQRKHQSSASLAPVRGIHRLPVNSLHKLPVTQKIHLFDDIIMASWIRKVWLNRHQLKAMNKWLHPDKTEGCGGEKQTGRHRQTLFSI